MEAVKNYLDRMFANLPNTPSVMRAKDELLQMMEDKYTELISEGKTENEAVGSVISEFGNLDELAEALGVEEEENCYINRCHIVTSFCFVRQNVRLFFYEASITHHKSR